MSHSTETLAMRGACLNCGAVIPDAVALFCSAACWYEAVLLKPGGQRCATG